MNRTVIISGSRTFTDYELVKGVLDNNPWRDEMCHVYVGDARGVDALALRWCKENGITYTIHRAEWDVFGRSAGPERNEEMVKQGGSALILIWDGESKGSASMKRIARKWGIPVYDPLTEEKEDVVCS